MKKLLSLAALVLMLCVAACQQGGYKISGTVQGAADGDTVILANVKSMYQVDTLQQTLIKGGKFEFAGKQDSAMMCYVIWNSTADPDLRIATQVALEDGAITVELDTAENTFAKVGGTPANDALYGLAQEEQGLNDLARTIYEVMGDSAASDLDKAEAERNLNDLQDKAVELYQKFIAANIQNVAGQTYLMEYASMLGDDFVAQQLEAIPDVHNSTLDELREVYAVKAKTAVGQPMLDIKAKNPEGADLSVAEVAKGAKVLMIDFGPSWCGPCRAEMPNVKAAYEKFHPQGFDIIGVSLDQDAEAWKKAIADLGMAWPQISDLKGWDCEGASAYGVRAIPATVLVKDGKIVARDVRGEALAAKIEELLKD